MLMGGPGWALKIWPAFTRTFFCAALVLGMFLSFGCRNGARLVSRKAMEARYDFSSPHMGTLFNISLCCTNASGAKMAAKAAFDRVARLDEMMSDYRVDSELMLLCEHPSGEKVKVSPDLFHVLERAQEISTLSHGAFDITVGPYVRLWRFSRKRKVLPTHEELAVAKEAVGYRKIQLYPRSQEVKLLAPNMRLDLGGIAKGYAADEALRVLRLRGISRAYVAASGDIAVGDSPPGSKGWKISIATIDSHDKEMNRTVLVHNCGISTSGDSEQAVEINGARYSHIVSPLTGLGLTNRIQVSVVAPNATTTDGWATAFSVMGANATLSILRKLPGTGVLIMTERNGRKTVEASPNFHRLAPEIDQQKP